MTLSAGVQSGHGNRPELRVLPDASFEGGAPLLIDLGLHDHPQHTLGSAR
jgi:hypothetical protein